MGHNLNASTMDPQSSELLKQMNAARKVPFESLKIEEARKEQKKMVWQSPIQLKRIENIHIPGPQGEIPIRIYGPYGNGPFPVLVYYHGGGFVMGDLDIGDPQCRSIADLAQMVVVSVDYRLAPENKFPKPLIDCFAATQWVENNIALYEGDPSRLAVGGASSGATLAAAVTHMAKQQGRPIIHHQLLIVPGTDCACATPSMKRLGEGYGLTLNMMKWFWQLYLNTPEEGFHPFASPARADDFSNLPPALFVLAEFDPLYDEGVQYAEKLKTANVPVRVLSYPSFHSFVGMSNRLVIAKQALQDIATHLYQHFHS